MMSNIIRCNMKKSLPNEKCEDTQCVCNVVSASPNNHFESEKVCARVRSILHHDSTLRKVMISLIEDLRAYDFPACRGCRIASVVVRQGTSYHWTAVRSTTADEAYVIDVKVEYLGGVLRQPTPVGSEQWVITVNSFSGEIIALVRTNS
jgi:hypothetical protein